jgi:CENP-S associating Centromere protein X
MPPVSSSNPVRRKGPAFKPPRPVKPPAQSAATSNPARHVSNNAAPRTSGISKKVTSSRPSFHSAATLISSSEQEDEDDIEAEDEDEEMEDKEISQPRPGPSNTTAVESTASQGLTRPAIPPALLARLLHEGFEDKEMKIQKEAMSVVGKYMETFVREAVARAAFEREDAVRGGGISDGFLQVGCSDK